MKQYLNRFPIRSSRREESGSHCGRPRRSKERSAAVVRDPAAASRSIRRAAAGPLDTAALRLVPRQAPNSMKFEPRDLGCYRMLLPPLCALALFATVSVAWAIPLQYVVPNNLANVEGNTSVNDFLNASSFRMQMVFDASQFGGLGSGPGISNLVTSIAFRLDGGSANTVASFFGGSSVTLSTTLKSPDSLSPVFAENVGSDAVTIFNGAIGFGTTLVPGAMPQPFHDSVLATAPFYYFPSQGNLLVDIRARSGQVLFPGALDAQAALGDPVSRVFAADEVLTSGTIDSLGLVTRFNIAVIPEPATWSLLVMGLTLTALVRRRKAYGSH